MNKKVVFITGCSSGIGYLTARLFARNGWKVFAGIRDLNGEGANKLANIAKLEELDLQLVEIDVSSETSVDNALTKFKQEQFQIDVLINNAGFGYVGPVEVFSDYEVKNQYETNVYGVLRVSRHLIPLMRAQKSGTIINISSIAGLTPFPLYGLYASSKFALESLSEAMAFELNHFGIKVSLVEPGTFETNFSKNLKKSDNIEAFPEYNRLTENFASRYNKVRPRQDPEKVARQIWEIANTKKPKMRYVVGLDAKVYILAKKLLPYPIWFNILRLIYKW
ncbi:hypothetical protein A2619_02120 [candidate division WWE3 bacterium RIFOXYD1_FULL_39_9]|uniref:Short-chain dehydrogenase/reductase n=1 Tax=candidate division WWE3 bacterium RIFOXYD1_FULL_39_9 TaxID=1802649 RepID=A0A1F4X356_UNCKA|nr:MAG: hypothetical protein A2619_02120 [candidate division WWE3 bacterium RIFOXYD1_FULL_39_9]